MALRKKKKVPGVVGIQVDAGHEQVVTPDAEVHDVGVAVPCKAENAPGGVPPFYVGNLVEVEKVSTVSHARMTLFCASRTVL
jgi:hypothetical protein